MVSILIRVVFTFFLLDNCHSLSNITNILDKVIQSYYDPLLRPNYGNGLLDGYDNRLRPCYGSLPVKVGITLYVSTISAVSEVDMDFTIDLYLRQFWVDNRLKFDGPINESLTVGVQMIDKIWVPDTFFPNEKRSFFHEATSHNSFLRINSKGGILRSLRLTVTTMCSMDLKYFPLDRQTCTLEIESYGYSTADIAYYWMKDKNGTDLPVEIAKDVNLAQFDLIYDKMNESFKHRTINLSTGSYSRLSAEFRFKRNIGFYLIQIYLPSSLIVVISWVSFWLNREATQARVAIGVTTVLTMTTLMTSTNASMPKVSYVKSIDIYLGTCFIIVFASLLEYAAVGYLMKRVRMKQERRQSSGMDPNSVSHTAGYACVSELSVPSVDPSMPATDYRPYKTAPDNFSPSSSHPLLSHSPSHPHHISSITSTPSHNTNMPCCGGLGRRKTLTKFRANNNSDTHLTSPVLERKTLQATLVSPNTYATGVYAPECDCDIEMAYAGPSGLGFPLPPRLQTYTVKKLPTLKIKSRYKKQSFKPSSIDKYSRIFFPLSFVTFHLIYWSIYLGASQLGN